MKINDQASMLVSQALQNAGTTKGNDKQRMVETARDFEAIFVKQMFKGMRRTIPEGGLLPRGNAEEIYYDMQDMEAAKQATAQGGIGLSKVFLEQMSKYDN